MPQQPRAWPIRSGAVPALADGFTWRPETGQGPWHALRPGFTIVLGPAEPRGQTRSPGGTGKTQLAAAFAERLWAAGELDLLVWMDAGSRDAIVSGYAGALADVQVAAPPGQPEATAARFLTWLAGTGRRWLVVLDGLAAAADADGLWPRGPSGQALVTTGLTGLLPKPARVPGGPQEGRVPAREHLTIALSEFSQREALSYLSGRLNDDPYQVAGSLDLAVGLSCLPAGLNLAVCYVLDSGFDCRQYRVACDQYRQSQGGRFATDPLAASWMLAVDRARQLAPAGLAWPALKLAAILGPARVPGAVLTSSAACAYITGRQQVTSQDQASVRLAFANLQRLGLVAIDAEDEVRTVSMRASLQSSVRMTMSQNELRHAVLVAADAVCERWPETGAAAALEQALRDCATSVGRCDDLALWNEGCHPLLGRLGRSLDDAKMAETAVAYWRELAVRSAEYLGTRSLAALQFRDRLAGAAAAAGRTDEAISLREGLVADLDHVLGAVHPQAITSRASLALAYRTAGRLAGAISTGERVAADSDLIFGPAHPQTTEILRELGTAYADNGRFHDAAGILQRCLGFRERTIGLMHPETVSMRRHLAQIYRRAGQQKEAIKLAEDTLAQAERAFGATHPDTLAARQSLAIAYYHAGQNDDATSTFEQVLAGWQRMPGVRPASTIAARANLAAVYCLSSRVKEAIPLYESELADLELIKGPDHPDTLRGRWNLAAACHKAKRLPESVKLGESTLAECEQVLGPGHWETLTTRANLAHAYHAAGQLKRASAHFDRALRDCEQCLGPDDPLTTSVRVLRKRYLAGRQGAAPIITPPAELPGDPLRVVDAVDGAQRHQHLAEPPEFICFEGERAHRDSVPSGRHGCRKDLDLLFGDRPGDVGEQPGSVQRLHLNHEHLARARSRPARGDDALGLCLHRVLQILAVRTVDRDAMTSGHEPADRIAIRRGAALGQPGQHAGRTVDDHHARRTNVLSRARRLNGRREARSCQPRHDVGGAQVTLSHRHVHVVQVAVPQFGGHGGHRVGRRDPLQRQTPVSHHPGDKRAARLGGRLPPLFGKPLVDLAAGA